MGVTVRTGHIPDRLGIGQWPVACKASLRLIFLLCADGGLFSANQLRGGISLEMVMRLSQVFGGSAESWITQQAQYQLADSRRADSTQAAGSGIMINNDSSHIRESGPGHPAFEVAFTALWESTLVVAQSLPASGQRDVLLSSYIPELDQERHRTKPAAYFPAHVVPEERTPHSLPEIHP